MEKGFNIFDIVDMVHKTSLNELIDFMIQTGKEDYQWRMKLFLKQSYLKTSEELEQCEGALLMTELRFLDELFL